MDRRGLTIYAEYPIISASHVVTITVCVGMGGPTSMLSRGTLLRYFQVLLIQKKWPPILSQLLGCQKATPILFLLSPEVSGTSGTMSMYIYIYMSTTWQMLSRYISFQLYFGEIHSFAPDFISEESFRPEEFFEVLF